MAKINHLLENRIDLSTYEAKFGPLPAKLRCTLGTDAVEVAGEEESESELSSAEPSGTEDGGPTIQSPSAALPTKKPEDADANFFNISLGTNRFAFPSFTSLQQQINKPKS